MIGMPVTFQKLGDASPWPELDRNKIIHLKDGMSLAVLDAGMTGGRPSVALRIDLPDGKSVVYETSARLFCLSASMIAARYPDLFVDN